MKKAIQSFPIKLLAWHKTIVRKMPWKETSNPYFIWLSEIIMQQTRVEQGTPYYLKFVKQFPTVHDLANASEDTVMQAWEGLGYYSRARNLHASAKYISEELGGVFPQTHEEILKLKGVGPYTAAAIASFAYDLEYPVVDGNVQRVLSRVFGILDPIDEPEGKKKIEKLSIALIKGQPPANYNQAIMDFGATLCKPKKPLCGTCPLQEECISIKKNLVDQLPKKNKKIKKRNRYFHYLILEHAETLFLQKRGAGDVWQGLYEFPLLETEKPKVFSEKEMKKVLSENGWILKKGFNVSKAFHQTLSHQKIEGRFYTCPIQKPKENKGKILVERNNLINFAFPKIINCYLDDNSVYLL